VYLLNEAMDGEVRHLETGMFREPEVDIGQTVQNSGLQPAVNPN